MKRKTISERLEVFSSSERGASLDFTIDLETNKVIFTVETRLGHWVTPTAHGEHAFRTYAEAKAFFDAFESGKEAEA